MASIPLPALDLKPVQQPDMMGDVSKLMALKSMMTQQQSQQQELQIRAQQVKDQQATTTAMRSVDPSNSKYKSDPTSYYADLARSVLENGGSATAAQGVQQHGLTVTKTVSDIAAQDAATGSKNLETFIGRHKAIGDALEGIESVPDTELHAAATQKVSELTKSGLLDAQSGQQLLQGIQAMQDPKQLREKIDIFAKSSMGAKAVADKAKTEQETKTSAAQEQKDTADTEKTKLETQLMQQYGTPAQQEAKYVALQTKKNQGLPLAPPEAAFAKSYEHLKTLVPTANFNLQNAGVAGAPGQPSAIAKGLADSSMKWNDVVSARTPMSVKQSLLAEVKAIKPDFNSGDFDVEKQAKISATSGTVGQSLLAIGTAREHMKLFTQLADALDNNDVQALNKVGNFLGIQFGSDKATNLKIASQAFGGEVGRAFDGAGVIGKEREQAAAAYADYLSKGQFKGAVATVDKLLAGKQKAAHDWFDKAVQAKPDFGNEKAPAAPGGKEQNFFENFGGSAH